MAARILRVPFLFYEGIPARVRSCLGRLPSLLAAGRGLGHYRNRLNLYRLAGIAAGSGGRCGVLITELLARIPDAAMPTTTAGAIIFVIITVVGLFVWLVRHVLTVTIPDLTRTFNDTNTAERRLCAEQFALINGAISALAVVVREGHVEQVSDLKSHMTAEIQKYRHDIYDKIHAAVLTREAYARMKEREAEREAEERARQEEGRK